MTEQGLEDIVEYRLLLDVQKLLEHPNIQGFQIEKIINEAIKAPSQNRIDEKGIAWIKLPIPYYGKQNRQIREILSTFQLEYPELRKK